MKGKKVKILLPFIIKFKFIFKFNFQRLFFGNN